MNLNLIPQFKKHIEEGLAEDTPQFDWSAHSTVLSDKNLTAHLVAKEAGVWVGSDAFKAAQSLSHDWGKQIKCECFKNDGEWVQSKEVIVQLTGAPEMILGLERTLINLTAFTSGIATATRRVVDVVQKSPLQLKPRITPTRKTLPGYRDLSLAATLYGGAHPHRYNLSGGVLIKENHIRAAGGIRPAIKNAKTVAPHLLKIEVEVTNLLELKEALNAQADVIMLDNFLPKAVQEAILVRSQHQQTQGLRQEVLFEVSGGISMQNLSDYLIEGVDIISMGGLTHSVKSLDLSLLVQN